MNLFVYEQHVAKSMNLIIFGFGYLGLDHLDLFIRSQTWMFLQRLAAAFQARLPAMGMEEGLND